ncbi:mycothiol transferase [Gordonia sp. CPCC 205333]|uniref:mycothiol transferase n=1 Tax=Gordonia sp. CPCC 205333 TaxID=3140790 RepID=UPI003AF34701
MRATDVLADGFSRVQENVHAVVTGLDVGQLAYQPGPQANTIAWLVWHLTRVQDDHVSNLPLAGSPREQVWRTGGFARRFALPFDESATGYGHTIDEVSAVRASARDLVDYYDATHAATQDFLATITDDDLNTVVDTHWNPPVTMGVRLVSVLDDDAQHIGQAAYIRGLL